MYVRYFLYDSMRAAMEISNTQLGMLSVGSVIIGIFLTLPNGWLGDHYSSKKLLVNGLFWRFPLVTISVIWINVQFVVFMAMSVSMIGFVPAILRCVRIVGGENQGSTFGIFEASHGSVAMMGNFIALFVFSRFANEVIGYRVAYFSMGVIALIAAFVIAFFFEDIPIEERILDDAAPKRSMLKDSLAVMKDPSLWLIGITVFAVYGVYSNSSYFTPYFTGVLGAAITITGIFSIFRDYGSKIVGGFLGSGLAHKLGSTPLLNGICLLINAVLIFAVSHLSPNTPHILAICMGFVLINSLFLCISKSTYWANIGEAGIPLELNGAASVIIAFIGFSMSDIIFPITAGRLLDTYANDLPKAYGIYFTLLTCVCLVGSLCAFTVHFRNQKRKKILKEFGD